MNSKQLVDYAQIFKVVVNAVDIAGLGADADADFLAALAGVGYAIVANFDVGGGAHYIYADSIGSKTIVADGGQFDQSAVAAAKFAQGLAEEQADLLVVDNGRAHDMVIGIAVANGDAVVAVAAQRAIIHQAVGDAPAKEDALAIAVGDTIVKDGAL